MSLLDEYGENKYNKGKEEGIEEIVLCWLKTGAKPETIAINTKLTLKDINKIKNKIP